MRNESFIERMLIQFAIWNRSHEFWVDRPPAKNQIVFFFTTLHHDLSQLGLLTAATSVSSRDQSWVSWILKLAIAPLSWSFTYLLCCWLTKWQLVLCSALGGAQFHSIRHRRGQGIAAWQLGQLGLFAPFPLSFFKSSCDSEARHQICSFSFMPVLTA